MIGPDATGAGWVYEYALLDQSHTQSLADLRSLQDWNVRYALETVPGVAEVATIGGFVKQYQVKLDPNRLLALKVPLETVIDKIRDSNGEVGGRMLEMSGADYLIRGLGYVRSVADLEQISVATNNGTPVLIRDLGVVSLGPDLREGAAEWNGDGETVGGIVVMRYGQNALNVIDGVKHKLAEIQKTLPARCRNRRRLRPFGTYSGIDQDAETRPARGGDNRQPRDHHFSVSFPLGADPDSCAADRGHRDVHPDVLAADQLQHHVAGRAWRWRSACWSTRRS